jgi:hypothetical protein
LKQLSQIENLEKLNFVVTSCFLNDQFGGVKRSLKFLGEAGKFRLVISESKFVGRLNHNVSTHQRSPYLEHPVFGIQYHHNYK